MATLTVTTNSDSGTGSLREAIANASSGDTIVFDPVLHGSTILLASQLTPGVSLEIVGALSNDDGLPLVAIDGGGSTRGFAISAQNVTLTLRKLTLQNCKTSSPGGAVQLSRSNGRLVATDCIFDSNSARQGADLYGVGSFTACAFFDSRTTGAAGAASNASGGCVCNPYGTACVFEDCDFNSPSSNGSGAVYYSATASATFTRCTIPEGDAYDGVVCAEASFEACEIAGTLALSGASTLDNSNAPTVSLADSSSLTVAGRVAIGSLLAVDASCVLDDAYLGIGELDGSVAFSGAGRLASNDVQSTPSGVILCPYGAGIASFSRRDAGSGSVALSWTVENSVGALLERKIGDAWTVVNTSATSPVVVPIDGPTRFRLFDGLTLLEVVGKTITEHAWVVYANTIVVDTAPAVRVITGYLMMSSYYNRGETPILFARLEDSATGDPLDPSLVESASYTVYRKTFAWGNETRTEVAGHVAVPVPTSAFLASLVDDDPRWTTDSTGYNFVFEPDATATALFSAAGDYVVVVNVNLTSGNPVPIVYEISAN